MKGGGASPLKHFIKWSVCEKYNWVQADIEFNSLSMATNSTSTDRVKISSDYNILFFANAPFKID